MSALSMLLLSQSESLEVSRSKNQRLVDSSLVLLAVVTDKLDKFLWADVGGPSLPASISRLGERARRFRDAARATQGSL